MCWKACEKWGREEKKIKSTIRLQTEYHEKLLWKFVEKHLILFNSTSYMKIKINGAIFKWTKSNFFIILKSLHLENL